MFNVEITWNISDAWRWILVKVFLLHKGHNIGTPNLKKRTFPHRRNKTNFQATLTYNVLFYLRKWLIESELRFQFMRVIGTLLLLLVINKYILTFVSDELKT